MTSSGYDHNRDDLAVGYVGTLEARYIDMSLPFSAGALYSTVEDLYLWDRALNSEALLTQDSLNQMFTEHAPGWGTFSYGSGWSGEFSYGYGWDIGTENGHRVFVHGDDRINDDGYRSQISRFPDDNITIIVLSNQIAPLEFVYGLVAKRLFGSE